MAPQESSGMLYAQMVGPGWWDLRDKYIQQILAIAPDSEIWVKEKFGTLRIRAFSPTHQWMEFWDIERAAERESATICEVCGSAGKLRTDRSYIQTLCARCAAADVDTCRRISDETEKRWLEKHAVCE